MEKDKATVVNLIEDVQNETDARNLPINQVGIKSFRYPVQFVDADKDLQHTVASFTMTVHLPAQVKGTHMSRFIALLHEYNRPLSVNGMHTLLNQMLDKLTAKQGLLTMSFPFFAKKTAPVTQVESVLDYNVTLAAEKKDGDTTVRLCVEVPITSLCPCSKKISEYGAHNQRSHVTVTLLFKPIQIVSITEVIDWIEKQASCQLYSILKRADEKYVTEQAYENPKFVEDLVRDIALILQKDSRFIAYQIESENFESIHNHSAYAKIES